SSPRADQLNCCPCCCGNPSAARSKAAKSIMPSLLSPKRANEATSRRYCVALTTTSGIPITRKTLDNTAHSVSQSNYLPSHAYYPSTYSCIKLAISPRYVKASSLTFYLHEYKC